MRITITTTDNATVFMRRAGYGYQKEGAGEVAFVRRVGSGLFPRYHVYATESDGQVSGVRCQVLTINLHVDQKAPTYQQGRAHSGEYDGPLIEQEAARLRALAQAPMSGPSGNDQEPTRDDPTAGRGFWRRLFS